MLRTLIPGGMSSWPMPSPAMTAMRYVFMSSRLQWHQIFWCRVRVQVLQEPVLLIDGDHLRLDLLVGQAERHDDHLVARMKMPRRGAVDDDLSRASRQAVRGR